MGSDQYEMKSWTTIKFPTKEKIAQLSCAYDYTLVVTTNGNFYCAGNMIQSKINLPNANKFEKIDLGQSVKAIKAAAGYSATALVLVKNNGVNELWSGGYNAKGGLGSGENVTTKSAFGRMAYDATNIIFVDVSIYMDHAAAITDKGELY